MTPTEIPIKRFFMLRHGESEANAAKTYSGQIDTPLTVKGLEEAHNVAKVFEHLDDHPKVVIHSHLQRAKNTAIPSATILNLETIEIPEWAEQFYGDWQGVAHDKVRHLREAGINPPNGESNKEFYERIMLALKQTLEEHDDPLVVCHGGCFRAISSYYDGRVRGARNCVLHEFIPSENKDKIFPWDVYVHEVSPYSRRYLEAFDEDLVT